MNRLPLPWGALQESLGGGLLPGVVGLTGPIGSGKTQLALSIAAHVAERGAPVVISAPRIDPRELRARLEGIRTQERWADLYERSNDIPSSIIIAGEAPERGLLVIDDLAHDEDELLARARRAALDRQDVVLVVIEPRNPEAVTGFVPIEILRRSPAEIAAWTGVSPRTAAEVDALLVLAPERPRVGSGWMTVELAIAKLRRGVPGRAVLRFNGSWFEEEIEELDLEVS